MIKHHNSIVARLALGILVIVGTGAGCSSTTSGGSAGNSGGTANATGGAVSNPGGAPGSAGAGGSVDNSGGTTSNVGSGGDSGSVASGGAVSAGGASGSTDPCSKSACASPATCTPVAPSNALITDWTDVCTTTGPNGCLGLFVDNDTFSTPGDNWWTKFYGGTYVYPAIDPKKCTADPQYPLGQTVAAHAWHITGSVGTYSGFGIWLAPCMADMSAYPGGISITLSGSAGSKNTLVISLLSSSDTAHEPTSCNSNVGTCTVSTCKAPSKTVTLTSTATAIDIPWTDFTGGNPDASPQPSEITGIAFSLPDPYDYTTMPATATPYSIDITVGDISLY